MEFLIVPIEDLKEFDKEWEYRRRSNDGTKAIIHRSIFDSVNPMAANQVMTLNLVEGEEPQEPQYPYPLVSGEELDKLPDFMPVEEPVEAAPEVEAETTEELAPEVK